MSSTQPESSDQPDMPFFGLAPFLRMSIAGDDLLPYGQQMLALAGERPNDARHPAIPPARRGSGRPHSGG